jgi:hypothetical protein
MKVESIDFAKLRIVYTGEGAYVFFNCCACGRRCEHNCRTYLVQGNTTLGQCCTDCIVYLHQEKNVKGEEWPHSDVDNDGGEIVN